MAAVVRGENLFCFSTSTNRALVGGASVFRDDGEMKGCIWSHSCSGGASLENPSIRAGLTLERLRKTTGV